jgi:hypothetical protein
MLEPLAPLTIYLAGKKQEHPEIIPDPKSALSGSL